MRALRKYLSLMMVSILLGFLSVNAYAISDEPAFQCDSAKKDCNPKVSGKHAISDEPAFRCDSSKKDCKDKNVDKKTTTNVEPDVKAQ